MATPAVLRRPVRATALGFLGLAALLAVCFPFTPNVDPAEFLLGGLAYSLVLSAVGVGLVLVSRRARRRWAAAGAGVAAGMAGFAAWLWAARPEPSAAFFTTLRWWLGGVGATVVAFLAATVVLAGSGWIRSYRGTPDAAEPVVAPDPRRR